MKRAQIAKHPSGRDPRHQGKMRNIKKGGRKGRILGCSIHYLDTRTFVGYIIALSLRDTVVRKVLRQGKGARSRTTSTTTSNLYGQHLAPEIRISYPREKSSAETPFGERAREPKR
eukprot:120856-Rhodomonas_salina.1